MNKEIIDAVNKFGTPLYLYNKEIISEKFCELKENLLKNSLIYYSMKSNSLLGICQLMKEKGCGIEVASKGEMFCAIKAGFDTNKIIFTSPGKTINELKFAIEKEIKLINVESLDEIILINKIAFKNKKKVKIAIRVNPNFNISNAKIKMSGVSSQFGIEEEQLNDYFFNEVKKLGNIILVGIQVYMGTQMLEAEDIIKNTKFIIELGLNLSYKYCFDLAYLNMGGGFGIPYFPNENPLDMRKIKKGMDQIDKQYAESLKNTELIFESGRYLMAESAVYITKVLYTKDSKKSKYIICDGGSNFHSASAFLGRFVRNNYPIFTLPKKDEMEVANVVGPLCTPTDVLGQKVEVGKDIEEGDLVVIEKSGAYGLTYSPILFLSHETPNEVMYYKEKYYVLRERGTVEDLLKGQNSLNGDI